MKGRFSRVLLTSDFLLLCFNHRGVPLEDGGRPRLFEERDDGVAAREEAGDLVRRQEVTDPPRERCVAGTPPPLDADRHEVEANQPVEPVSGNVVEPAIAEIELR